MPKVLAKASSALKKLTTFKAAQDAFLHEVGAVYLSKAETVDPEELRNWQPAGLAWPLMRDLQRRATGMRRHVTEVDGHKVVWMEGGNAKGEAVVLLHGFTSSKENWLLMAPFLLSRFHVYAPDLPGWGESQFIHDADYSMDAQVARVAEWAKKHVKAPAHVVGSSMGGAVAGLLAARHPELVETLTLMNSAGVRGANASPFEQGLLEGKNGLIARTFADVMQLFESVVERNRMAITLALAPAMYGDFVNRRSVNLHLFSHLVGRTPSEKLPGIDAIKVPTLVLWGEQDRILDVSCADAIAAVLPHAEVKRLNRVGHLPMIEVPGVTARRLRGFWHRNAAAVPLAQAA
ncbi:MAG: alpha/beta fold hydrolase [Pseudomonadota bacterium]